MKTPPYRPASHYVPPEKTAFEFTIDTVVISELMQVPSLMAILSEKYPRLNTVMHSSQLKVHLSNFTLRTLSEFGILTPEQVTEIDTLIRELPTVQRPQL